VSAAENTLEPLASQTAIPDHLLMRDMQFVGIELKIADLSAAQSRAAESMPDVSAAERLRYVFTQLQLKGLQPVPLMWRRFDLQRLPALVQHDDQWFYASAFDGQAITLLDADEQLHQVDESALQDAKVIWLKGPQQRSKSTALDERGNIAAKMVWRALFKNPAWVTKVLLATFIINTLAVATSIFAMQVYDRVVPTLAYATLTTLVTGMLIIIILDWLLKTLRARILDSVSIAVDKQVSQQVFDHLLHLRLDIQPKSLGTLAAQVGGLDAVRQFFSASVVFGLIDLPFIIMFIAFIGIIAGDVAWVYVILFPIALLLGITTQFRLKRLLRDQMLRSNERQGVLVDAIRGAESIRANNAGWRFSQEWQNITASIDGYNIQQKAINSFSTTTTGSLSTLAYVSAVMVGVWQIEAGLLTMGGLIAASILGGRVIAPISQGVQYLAQWQNVNQALQMVNQILLLDLERRPNQTLLLPETTPTLLALDKVRFSYPESPVQQVHIPDLVFKAGERVLLVGAVGCGKSTLLKVMAGMYQPSEGRVRLGDADLWEMDPQLVASQVGYLPQNPHLFKGTLRSNLTLSGHSSDSRLLKVVRDLGVDEIAASSPQGMDLVISEGGDGLSGGQKQLVALSRVVIDQPTVWLLDEPTAALDGQSEAKVWDVLAENLRADDIFVVATHRPMQAVKMATRVVVMHQGEIIQDGKPDHVLPQLMARTRAQLAPQPPSVSGLSAVKGARDVI
jgi:ATP-binding cassette subfamily C protein LapB